MNPNIKHLDDFPPEQRLALYLEEALAGEDREDRLRQLATELGYKNAKTIHMWTTGGAKVPLRMILPIAQHLGVDVSNLIPLWISQEISGDDEDRLYQASMRMVSAWEWGLIAVARDIYRGDEDER